MRVIVDRDICQGHAQCEDVAPQVFAIDDSGKVVLLDASPPAELHRKVEEAVWLCPVGAIRVEDD